MKHLVLIAHVRLSRSDLEAIIRLALSTHRFFALVEPTPQQEQYLRIFSESEGDWTSPAMEMLIVSGAEFAGILIAWLLLFPGFRSGAEK